MPQKKATAEASGKGVKAEVTTPVEDEGSSSQPIPTSPNEPGPTATTGPDGADAEDTPAGEANAGTPGNDLEDEG